MRILVTGSNGFIGKELAKRLSELQFQVVTAGRNKIHDSAPSYHSIGSLDSYTDWQGILANCYGVMHLAARVHVMHDSAVDPLAAFREVNLHGTINLVRQAASAGVKRFVYVSSIKVNGEFTHPERPFTESDMPRPQDPYAVSKWEAEQALHTISRETGMEVVIVRPPLVYGPSVKANFARLLRLVERGMPLPLRAIHNQRSLIYVGNLVDALIRCATHPAAANQTYLVSDGEDVSTPQLIEALAAAMSRPSRAFSFPVNVMRLATGLIGKSAAVDRLTQSLVIDSSKIRSELGWQPPYSMAEGLRETALWYHQAKLAGRS